jgi:hypothetical protein
MRSQRFRGEAYLVLASCLEDENLHREAKEALREASKHMENISEDHRFARSMSKNNRRNFSSVVALALFVPTPRHWRALEAPHEFWTPKEVGMKLAIVLCSITVLLLSFCAPARAIEWVRLGPKWGIHYSEVSGGYTYTDIDLTVDEGWMSKKGIGLGLFFNVGLNKYLSIQPELYFAVKGTRGEFPIVFEDISGLGEYNIRLDYWELPLLLKLTYPTGLFLAPFVTAGPYVGYSTKADREAYFTPTGGYRMGVKSDVAEEFASYDYGVAVGGGIEFSIGEKIVLFTEARYQIGFANIRKELDDLKNRSISFTAGFSLPVYTP